MDKRYTSRRESTSESLEGVSRDDPEVFKDMQRAREVSDEVARQHREEYQWGQRYKEKD